MIWKGLMVVTGSESPIVVVLSGRWGITPAPAPAPPGDDIDSDDDIDNISCPAWSLPSREGTYSSWRTTRRKTSGTRHQPHRDRHLLRVGEIVVFKIDGRDIPIVHRVLKLHEKEDGSIKVALQKTNKNKKLTDTQTNPPNRAFPVPNEGWQQQCRRPWSVRPRAALAGQEGGSDTCILSYRIVLNRILLCCIVFNIM